MASSAEKHRALFGALVTSYTSQTMACLGKIPNPQTGKIERDLEQASVLIDMLHMLEAKTAGNLEDDEASMLRQSLSMLRLNYVDEVQKPAEQATGAEAGDEDAEASAASDTTEG